MFSIVLFAIVNADHCLTYVAVGCQGCLPDRWREGAGGSRIRHLKICWKKKVNTPKSFNLSGGYYPVAFVLLADDAFPSKPWIMKPLTGTHEKGSGKRICNYRLSRVMRVVENVFGVLSAVFRVLRKPMVPETKKTAKILMTATYLHNFLKRSDTSNVTYTPPARLILRTMQHRNSY